ncbi:MAG: chemotaxis protein CheW [Legionellaceae bacterium]|nr:chemotaxis protein CheW [Legionellaceae bacterium]
MSQSEMQQYLQLSMGEQHILLLLTQVQIVLRLPGLHQVPNHTKGFEGILNYHGVSVPVYNLGSYVGIQHVQLDLDTPLVLCQLAEGLVGFLVSDVEAVVTLKKNDMQVPRLSDLPDFVVGVYESEAGSMWVIQVEALIDPKAHLAGVADG